MKTAIEKVTWVGRVTVFAVSLAVVLALSVGLATTALAAVPGDPFKLGKINTINKITQLVGANPNNALLRIDNNSTGASATALELQGESGKPPMRVNSTTEVQHLNVDQVDSKSAGDFLGDDETATNASNLDGKDSTAFFSGKIYNTVGSTVVLAEGQSSFATALQCNFVLEGELTCDVGGEIVVAPAGSYVLKPRDVPHALYNAGTVPVRVLEILTPGGFESYFDAYEEIASRTLDEEEHRRARAELGERYGVIWHDERIPEVRERLMRE
jgi:quercetin dioxygenase-like cupin family protein